MSDMLCSRPWYWRLPHRAEAQLPTMLFNRNLSSALQSPTAHYLHFDAFSPGYDRRVSARDELSPARCASCDSMTMAEASALSNI